MIDGAIQRKVCGIGVIVASRAGVIRAGKGTCLVILNEGVEIRIIKSLENSGVLIGGVSEIVKHEIKKQEGGFLGMLLGTLSVERTGRGYNNMDRIDKKFEFCSIL